MARRELVSLGGSRVSQTIGGTSALTGIVVDLSENDVELIDAQFERFKIQYATVSRLVPEWEANYPIGPVDRLGEALQTGDRVQVTAAVGTVGKVCHHCHVATMANVQHRYHWGSTAQIRVTDTVTSEELDYQRLMRGLESSLAGIGVDLGEQQVENARAHFEALRERFQLLKVTCFACHETERRYFVDRGVQGTVESLGKALRSVSPDPEVVRALSQDVAMEGCVKCHWVHSPAALANERWEASKNTDGR